MRKVNNLGYLSSNEHNGNSLRVVNGNPLMASRSVEGNKPQLTLVWGKPVSEGSSKRTKRESQVSVDKGPLGRLRAWANANDGFLTIIGLVVAAGFFFGSWYMKSNLKEELKEYVDTSLKSELKSQLDPIREDMKRMTGDISKLQTGLANLQGKLGSIAGIVYQQRAAGLGFTDAQISFVELVKSSKVSIVLSSQGWSYDFTLTLTDVKEDTLEFLVNGAINKTIVVDYVSVTIPKQVGVPLDLMEVIGGVTTTIPKPPPVWAVILDFPSSNTAVLAFGPRNSDAS